MDIGLPGLVKMWSGHRQRSVPRTLQGLQVLWPSPAQILRGFAQGAWREIVTVSLNFENASLDGIKYLSNHLGNWLF